MVAATATALAVETEHLRTRAMLRAGAAATRPDRARQRPTDADDVDDRPIGTTDDEGPTRPGRRDGVPAEVGP
jgi:hypothetical protein